MTRAREGAQVWDYKTLAALVEGMRAAASGAAAAAAAAAAARRPDRGLERHILSLIQADPRHMRMTP
jgi:hypothetical protein